MKLYIQMECILSGWQEMLATILQGTVTRQQYIFRNEEEKITTSS